MIPAMVLARRLLAAGSLATAAVLVVVLPQVSATLRSRADEVTASANNLRDGWDSGETTGSLTPSTLQGGSFGPLFTTDVNGQVYAQPVVAGGTVIVATENDYVYGLAAASGAVRWQAFLPALTNPSSPGTAWPAPTSLCKDLTPEVGVTSTPVYDPTTTTAAPNGAVYLVSEEVPAGQPDTNPAFYLHALDPVTGGELSGWPVKISGVPVNDPAVPFNAYTQLQRPALLRLGGSVYAAFGSHCDFSPYSGYVAGVNTASHAVTLWTDEAGVTDSQAGIWQSGGGLMSDGSGRIFFASGNGVSPPPGPGDAPPPELAESVVRLAVQAGGTLAAKDFFSPANAPALDATDHDFGSGSPVGLPFGTAAYPDLLLQAGKADGLFLLNRNHLGGREQGPGGSDAVVSVTGTRLPGQWGHPAAFADTPLLSRANVSGAHDFVYYLGKGDVLRYFKAGLSADGTRPLLADVANSSDSFGYTSGSPVVTSDGTTGPTADGSAVVWLVRSSGGSGGSGDLEAFPAVPPRSCTAAKPCTIKPLWISAPFNGAPKFAIAATDGGRVYIATRGVPSDGSNCPAVPSGTYCGQVLGFGSPSTVPLSGAAPVSFGDVAVGMSSGTQQVTVTNTSSGDVTVTAQPTAAGPGFAVAGPFEYTPTSGPVTAATFPQVLHPGDTLQAQGLTFAPGAPGMATGAVEFATDAVNFPVIGVSLTGTGTQNGFYGSAAALSYGSVPVGTSAVQQLTVTNGEAAPETLTVSGLTGTPFSVSGVPATPVQQGQSVPLTVTYQPTGTSGDAATLTLTGDDTINPPTTTPISLSGNGEADVSALSAGPPSLNLGPVPLGRQAQATIDLTNTGNLPATITATTAPPVPFGTPEPVPAGLPLSPGASVQVPVTFAPTSTGVVTRSYDLTWTDVAGTHQLSVPVTGTGVAAPSGIAVPPPGGGWMFNGSAKMAGTTLSLTRPVKNQAGSAVYSVPVPSSGLRASFRVKIGGGTGAEGMTFALLDATGPGGAGPAVPSSRGGSGPGLGFGGLPGIAVALVTSSDHGIYPSNRFVGIATGTVSCATGPCPLKFAATNPHIPRLRTGTHVVGVTVSGGTVTVAIDGATYLSAAVSVPSTVLPAFTASTTVSTDNHDISGAAVVAGGNLLPGPGGGWSYNGAATTSGSAVRLTQPRPNEAGSVVYPAPVTSAGLKVTFDAQLGDGTGATGGCGLTFALLNPAATTARTLGGPGNLLGLGTSSVVPGVGVVIATDGSHSPARRPDDFAALTVRVGIGGLRFQHVAHGIPPLRTGTHLVTVQVTKVAKLGLVVTVWLDGVQVLQRAEPSLGRTVRLAFTAGTGTAVDLHLVRSVSIAAAG